MTHAHAIDAALHAAAREHRGRLVALLAKRTRDIAAAEDAVADALAQACATWPRDGVPRNPAGWLLAVARNRWHDAIRRARVAADFAVDWLHHLPQAHIDGDSDDLHALGDERLALMFVCAHPALNSPIHAPLMLQVVLGVPVERMAGLFLVSPGTLGQRLSRAKAKILDAGIAFEIPAPEQLPGRLPGVLDAIYAAYGLGWSADGPDEVTPRSGGVNDSFSSLAAEAIGLARLLAAQLPQAEVLGLLALMLWCESRSAARRDITGQFVPLEHQDVTRWDRSLMDEAANLLVRASRAGQPGRYQLEAAIQSVHARRANTGQTDWEALALLYRGLLSWSPTLGYQLGFISVLARLEGAHAAWEHLSALPLETVRTYQPYWVLRAHLHRARGQQPEAEHAQSVALGLTRRATIRQHLSRMLSVP